MGDTTETLIRVFENVRSNRGQCRACRADIEWFDTLKGNHMPMNAGAVPRKSETDTETGHVIVFFAAADSHWSTCPKAASFGGKR